jgi:hypothetical protein
VNFTAHSTELHRTEEDAARFHLFEEMAIKLKNGCPSTGVSLGH